MFEITGSGFVTCYLRGTRITTPTGDRAIESLVVNDLIVTASGEARRVVWIGHRHLDCGRHPKPETVWPVCVREGAFGDDLPRRDLWLSPDHAVFVDNVLIPIKHLVNGVSIAQVRRNDVVYYHIELDQHAILLAEGLPAESYLDVGDRCNFDNGGRLVMLHPDLAARAWDAKGCAPLVLAGMRLAAARRHISARARSFEPEEMVKAATA